MKELKQEHDRISEAEKLNAAPGAQQIDITALFREHQQHLFRFVKRYVRNDEDAEDVVQNTFIEAVRCADRFSGLSKPSTWLFGIALNLAHNQVRRNRANPSGFADDEFLEQVECTSSNPAMIVEQRQIAAKIDEMLADLPAKIRDTFLVVLEGSCTYEEAATQLNIPIGTVRSRVSRVRNAIRATFAE